MVCKALPGCCCCLRCVAAVSNSGSKLLCTTANLPSTRHCQPTLITLGQIIFYRNILDKNLDICENIHSFTFMLGMLHIKHEPICAKILYQQDIKTMVPTSPGGGGWWWLECLCSWLCVVAGLNLEIAESCSPGRGRPPGPPQLDEFLREVCGRQLAAAAVTAAPSRAAAAKKQDGPHQPAHSAEEGCKLETRHGRGVQLLDNGSFYFILHSNVNVAESFTFCTAFALFVHVSLVGK